MLDLLYHKHNHLLITTLVEKSSFWKIFKTMTCAKNVRRYYFYPGLRYYKDEVIINAKTYFFTDKKLFE